MTLFLQIVVARGWCQIQLAWVKMAKHTLNIQHLHIMCMCVLTVHVECESTVNNNIIVFILLIIVEDI